MIKQFAGEVVFENICMCEDYHVDEDEIVIGGECIASELEYARLNGQVTVAIADERFFGELRASGAWVGYSEWTPSSEDSLFVGEHNLKDVLRRYEGQRITMWVADEPVNVLEEE